MTACTVYHLPRGVTCDGCKRLTKRLHLVQHPRRRGYCPSCCTACARLGLSHPVAPGKLADWRNPTSRRTLQ